MLTLLQTQSIHDSMIIPKILASLTLQETQSIYDSMNIPKIEFIAYFYILIYISKIYNIFFIENLKQFCIQNIILLTV